MQKVSHHTLSLPRPPRALVALAALGAGGMLVVCPDTDELLVGVVVEDVWIDVAAAFALEGLAVDAGCDGEGFHENGDATGNRLLDTADDVGFVWVRKVLGVVLLA